MFLSWENTLNFGTKSCRLLFDISSLSCHLLSRDDFALDTSHSHLMLMCNVTLNCLGAKNFFSNYRLLNDSLNLSLGSGFLNYRCFLSVLSRQSLVLFFNNLFVLLNNYRLFDFGDKVFVLLMYDWSMNFHDFFFVDDWLMVFMDDILLRLMDHILVMLHDNILMVLVDYVSMVLCDNWSSHMCLHSCRNYFPIINSRKLFLLNNHLFFMTDNLRSRLKGSLNHWLIRKNSVLSCEALCWRSA